MADDVEQKRIVTDSDTGGMKETRLARFDLLPAEELWQVAEHYGRGAQKYEDRNWEKGYDWSLSFQSLQRHAWAFWNGEDIDPETGSHHMTAVIFHAFALMYFGKHNAAKDDRPNGDPYKDYPVRRISGFDVPAERLRAAVFPEG